MVGEEAIPGVAFQRVSSGSAHDRWAADGVAAIIDLGRETAIVHPAQQVATALRVLLDRFLDRYDVPAAVAAFLGTGHQRGAVVQQREVAVGLRQQRLLLGQRRRRHRDVFENPLVDLVDAGGRVGPALQVPSDGWGVPHQPEEPGVDQRGIHPDPDHGVGEGDRAWLRRGQCPTPDQRR
jgi:hypothetical protein